MGRHTREIALSEYLSFVKSRSYVVVARERIDLRPISVKRFEPLPDELGEIAGTVWSFPKRGSWAVHDGRYRGNWPPQIPRALILMYTEPGDVVLDPMVGGGTSLVEAKLLGRRAIGVDVNYEAAILTFHRMYWLEQAIRKYKSTALSSKIGGVDVEVVERADWRVYHGDARNLDAVSDNSVDLVLLHPPYYNIIRYSSDPHDLSNADNLEEFLVGIRAVAEEAFRVLKPGKVCAVLIGDTRAHKHYVPLTYLVLEEFLNAGFELEWEVVKIQHNMRTMGEVWSKRERDFLLIYHEKLLILRKPNGNNATGKLLRSLVNTTLNGP